MSRSRTPESSLGSMNRINFEGSNAGATMFIRRGTPDEQTEGCCCVNIYTNSNVQGTNSSVLLGSNIKMKNPGVHLYFGDLKLGEETATPTSISRRAAGATLEFGTLFLPVFILLILLLWLYSLLQL
ncbi:uncharacterized protein LOC111283571 [Durio zibethinus]|uniref:Uncharacterized protein LOC111283571 n=1 Tax=Durio zibethinus TaxID=66656 RepID=A0A6P5XI73_DURZI|nr:uncharacterized protein LOC111283571 [Durio zibethinus]